MTDDPFEHDAVRSLAPIGVTRTPPAAAPAPGPAPARVPALTDGSRRIKLMAAAAAKTFAGFFKAALGFSAALAFPFHGRWHSAGTLSIHAIHSARRSGWYWLAIPFTLALGTAGVVPVPAGSASAPGHLPAGLIFVAVVGAMTFAHTRSLPGGIAAFWMACTMAGPFGASFAELPPQPVARGTPGAGTLATSGIVLSVIGLSVPCILMPRHGRDDTRPRGGIERR